MRITEIRKEVKRELEDLSFDDLKEVYEFVLFIKNQEVMFSKEVDSKNRLAI